MEAPTVTAPIVGGKTTMCLSCKKRYHYDLIILNKEKTKQRNHIYIIPHKHVLWSINKNQCQEAR